MGFLTRLSQLAAFILGLFVMVDFLNDFYAIPRLIEETPTEILWSFGILLIFIISVIVSFKYKKTSKPTPQKPIYEDGYQLINGVKTSKPQIELCKMLTGCSTSELDKHCNIQVGYYYPDIIYKYCKDKIVVEYDGVKWHKEKNNKRDNALIRHGYKVLHLISNKDITEKEFTYALATMLVHKKQAFYYTCR